ncbi:class I SAM-dependent methyltransferase [Geomonas nitrogeniifigens]|uniref:Class I SAM-dependent methyltransferase n=1 Tax=Geomonas diazotrophica TaxID=2843197 RepID=A0ABX8JBZ5_9BACT|nr:class I SAM-dependent methyltransferase [Geomonas nitrogeniifigens]QWV95948.1 class I SAM-dependent methyltransferase [Geomonas nitrogeniifigens]
MAQLYEALENRGESNTHTDYTLSDLFVEWLAKNRPKEARILEMGCGGGYLAEAIRREGFHNLLASDFNAGVVETAVARFPALQGVVMDSEVLGLATGSVDCIVSVEMVEHLLDPQQHFHEVARVLKPGGVYLLRTPNYLAASVYYRWSGRYDMGVWHPSTFSSATLQRSLERHGLRVEHLPPRVLPKSQQEKLPKLLKFLARVPLQRVPLALRPSICVAATKVPAAPSA